MPEFRNDLTRTVLAVLFIGALIGFSLWILRPFLGALVWAVMIVVATWSLMLSAQTALGGRRWLAVAVMTLVLLLLLIVPLSAAIGTIVVNIDAIVGWAKSLSTFSSTDLPSWLTSVPIIGERLQRLWQDLEDQGIRPFAAKLAPYAGGFARWFVAEIGSFGAVFVQFLLTVVIAAILYARGEAAAERVLRFGRRLAGPRGEEVVRLSAQAIRGVALGVVVTALVQALIGGLGLLVAGVPYVAVLTAVMFMLAVAQIGAMLVMAVAVVWLYWTDAFGWGTFLLVVTIIVGTVDNFLRPILIRRGADLPLLLIFAGVIGGLISFGLIGIFIGPMVLAVTYTLVNAWIDEASAGQPRSISKSPKAKGNEPASR